MYKLTQRVMDLGPSLRFHLLMAGTAVSIVALSAAACLTGSIRIDSLPPDLVGVVVIAGMLAPLPAYWHQKGRLDKRDAALVIPWAFLLTFLLPLPFLVVARFHLPLQDPFLARFDHLLGFSTPAVMEWASHNRLGSMLNFSYGLLQPFMVLAVLVPALAGKREAKEFLLANLFGLLAAGVLFMLLPAIGPWYPHQFAADALQQECQNDLLRLRQPGTYTYSFVVQQAGIVCFPSCHVFWSVLSAAALWGFRWLRIPVAVLSAMIILSTMTTGWHYLADVLAGLILAAASLAVAKRIAQ